MVDSIDSISGVDILIPTYNQERYIEQCIQSALNQSYENINIIVVDDASTDNTENILKKYRENSKIKYIRNKENLGRVKNYRNALYEISSSEYILNLDGDDWLLDSEYVEKAVDILRKNPDVACVTGNKVTFIERMGKYLDNSDIYNQTLDPIMTGDKYLYEYALNKVAFSHLSTLYRRVLAINNNFYSKDITFTDGESIFRLICGRKIAYLPLAAGVWRIHQRNETKKFDIKNLKLRKFFLLEESVFQEYEKNYPETRYLSGGKLYDKLRIKRLKPFVYSAFKERRINDLLIIFIRLLRYSPVLFGLFIVEIFHYTKKFNLIKL